MNDCCKKTLEELLCRLDKKFAPLIDTPDPSVLAAEPNGDSSRYGYLKYLSFKDNKASLQVGAISGEDGKNIKFYDVPDAVAEAAIKAAMSVVTAWYNGRVGG